MMHNLIDPRIVIRRVIDMITQRLDRCQRFFPTHRGQFEYAIEFVILKHQKILAPPNNPIAEMGDLPRSHDRIVGSIAALIPDASLCDGFAKPCGALRISLKAERFHKRGTAAIWHDLLSAASKVGQRKRRPGCLELLAIPCGERLPGWI